MTAFTKVSVLIPTRNRLNRLEKMLRSYEETTSGSAELIFRLDDDDLDSQDLLLATRHKVIIGPRLEGYASLPTFFNQLAAAASGDVLLCGNDDMVFRTPSWDRLLLIEASKYPDGVFNLGVKTHNETHYPFCVVSRRVVECLGFVFDPRIFWGDIFLRDVMAFFGRSVMVPHIEIDHEWAGNSPDATFTQGEGTRRSNQMAHHPQAVQDAVEKLQQQLWEQPV